jgi:hypothetical protein
MPYSNRRRHNSPTIPQTPYQILIIPCRNFDPIYQVILLEKSNEWNLSPEKEGSSKEIERGARTEKKKRWNLSWKAPCIERKKRGWNLHATGRDSINRKKERRSHFPTVQNLMCGIIRTHTSFVFALRTIPWLFPFLPPFNTPFSINHDYLPHKLFRIFFCFYNIQGVA